MSRQIEVYKTTSPPLHLSSRTPTERLKPREIYMSYGPGHGVSQKYSQRYTGLSQEYGSESSSRREGERRRERRERREGDRQTNCMRDENGA